MPYVDNVSNDRAYFDALISETVKGIKKGQLEYVFKMEHVQAIQKVIPDIKWHLNDGIYEVWRRNENKDNKI